MIDHANESDVVERPPMSATDRVLRAVTSAVVVLAMWGVAGCRTTPTEPAVNRPTPTTRDAASTADMKRKATPGDDASSPAAVAAVKPKAQPAEEQSQAGGGQAEAQRDGDGDGKRSGEADATAGAAALSVKQGDTGELGEQGELDDGATAADMAAAIEQAAPAEQSEQGEMSGQNSQGNEGQQDGNGEEGDAGEQGAGGGASGGGGQVDVASETDANNAGGTGGQGAAVSSTTSSADAASSATSPAGSMMGEGTELGADANNANDATGENAANAASAGSATSTVPGASTNVAGGGRAGGASTSSVSSLQQPIIIDAPTAASAPAASSSSLPNAPVPLSSTAPGASGEPASESDAAPVAANTGDAIAPAPLASDMQIIAPPADGSANELPAGAGSDTNGAPIDAAALSQPVAGQLGDVRENAAAGYIPALPAPREKPKIPKAGATDTLPAEPTTADQRSLLGQWTQTAGDNGADFFVGGYRMQSIEFRPSGIVRIVRTFDEKRRVRMVARYRFTVEGKTLRLRPLDDDAGGRMIDRPIETKADGEVIRILPPAVDIPAAVSYQRDDNVLIVAGKTFGRVVKP